MASDAGNRGHLQREKILYQLHNGGAVQKIYQSHGEKSHGKDFRSDVFQHKDNAGVVRERIDTCRNRGD